MVNFKWDWDKLVLGVATVFAAIILSLIATAVVKSARSDGAIDYCYIESTQSTVTPYFELKGHRPWKSDARIGYFQSFEAAYSAAEKINCKFVR